MNKELEKLECDLAWIGNDLDKFQERIKETQSMLNEKIKRKSALKLLLKKLKKM